MPKCLDCGNTGKFWYDEVVRKLAAYDMNGNMISVVAQSFGIPYDETCNLCESKNIEGEV